MKVKTKRRKMERKRNVANKTEYDERKKRN